MYNHNYILFRRKKEKKKMCVHTRSYTHTYTDTHTHTQTYTHTYTHTHAHSMTHTQIKSVHSHKLIITSIHTYVATMNLKPHEKGRKCTATGGKSREVRSQKQSDLVIVM